MKNKKDLNKIKNKILSKTNICIINLSFKF